MKCSTQRNRVILTSFIEQSNSFYSVTVRIYLGASARLINSHTIIEVYFEIARENRIRISLWQLCAILGSMNGKSNSKVTRSESVHYAFSALVFPSDWASREGEHVSQDEAEWLLHISDYISGRRASCGMTLSM